jgi:hypothetical protein
LVDEIVSSKPFIAGRGEFFCRGCLGNNLFSALDLGDLPIANELLLTSESKIEKFPLHLRICEDCGLGQVADVVTPERIFRDYRYLSSMSTTFLKHASDFVHQLVKNKSFSSEDWVLEIASNDGYLLKNFVPLGVRVVGVEPAENVAEVSRSLGIETISEFFSSQLARDLLSQRGYPRLIVANNVMAHVPDLVDFIQGLSTLCGPTTEISIENPSIANILVEMQFDTIYHEHYSYLSATTVSQLSNLNGLQLFKVEELSIHGGSNRYWLRTFSEIDPVDPSVKAVILYEQVNELFDSTKWMNYSNRVSKVMRDFHTWLKNGSNQGMRIYGYGAAAKASTLLNAINLQPGLMNAIADASQEKQNRFMPPNGIKIISPQQLFEQKPTDIVIFPWNIKSEIALNLNQILGAKVRLWCAIPEIHQVQFS